MTRIEKTFPARTKTIDQEKGIFEVWISTEGTDRAGDIVRATGARLENYRKNPVVMYGHDYSIPPIAKALTVEILPGAGIKSRFKFPTPGIHPLADTIRGLWTEGFINAASIGFEPIKAVNLDPSRAYGPQEYTEWELLEWSIVSIPANQSALRLAYQKTLAKVKNGSLTDQALDLGLEVVKKAVRSGNIDQTTAAVGKFIDLIKAVLGVRTKY
ncbi:MAG: HK97 family phage prohead protease [Bellilinea sp.]